MSRPSPAPPLSSGGAPEHEPAPPPASTRERAAEIDLLLNTLSLSRLGGITTVECDSLTLRERLFRRLERELLERDIYLYPVELTGGDVNPVRVLRDLTGRSGFKDLELAHRFRNIALFLHGIEKLSAGQQEKILQFLNLFRDATARIKQPIVIWASSRFLREMAGKTPDFWSWKGVTYRFGDAGQGVSTPALQPVQQYARALRHDPDFAVADAFYVPGGVSREPNGLPAHPLRLRPGDRLLLRGEPGLGKSTLLRVLVYRYACFAAGRRPNASIPLYLELNRLSPETTLLALLGGELSANGLAELGDERVLEAHLFHRSTPSGVETTRRFVLLLDAADELAPGCRPALSEFVARLDRRHTVVISSSAALSGVELPRFKTRWLQAWDEPEVRAYTRHVLGLDDGNELAELVLGDERLRRLARLPLNLFMLAQVSAAGDGPLPTTPDELVARLVESLLQRLREPWWQLYGRARGQVSAETCAPVLAPLAARMQAGSRYSLPLEEFESFARDLFAARPVAASPLDILEALLYTGLLRLSRGREGISFLHPVVRDSFARQATQQ